MASVTIVQGTLRGGKTKTDGGFEYFEFLGVPYAKPPVAELRFKSPQPAEPWIGEWDATNVTRDKTSLIYDVLQGQLTGGEDCLYLNVYTPRLSSDELELLPVMVFIHGGGFVFGNGTVKNESGPDFLIEHGVVIVSINYRLSVFGFLALDIPEAAGNMGLKDQVEALKWVQANIRNFGGDKNNVTLFGVSAGAASVEYLMLSPKAEGLFHKAILQSGSCLNHWAVNYEPRRLAYQLAADLGYEGSEEDSASIYQCLFNAPADSLAAKSLYVMEKYTLDRVFFGFVPTVERDFGNSDAFLTENPYTVLKRGFYNRLPVIKGFCNKEGYLTCMMKPKAIADILKNHNFVDHWPFNLDAVDFERYGEAFRRLYVKELQLDDDDDKMAVDFYGDLDFVSGIWLSGKLMERNGAPVWFYEFSHEGDVNMSQHLFGKKRKGAGHADDGNYVICNDVSKAARDYDLTVRNAMCKMWTDFAKSSLPTLAFNVDNLEEWPTYTEDNPVYLNIDKEIQLKFNHEPEKMAVFEAIYEKYRK
ncbi:unnamed protein product, partial [Iphiclides podalirius]